MDSHTDSDTRVPGCSEQCLPTLGELGAGWEESRGILLTKSLESENRKEGLDLCGSHAAARNTAQS